MYLSTTDLLAVTIALAVSIALVITTAVRNAQMQQRINRFRRELIARDRIIYQLDSTIGEGE